MQVVTEKLELPPLTLQNPDGKRLMTVDIGTRSEEHTSELQSPGTSRMPSSA